MCDGPKELEALMAAQNSNLAQLLADVQKYVAILCRYVPQYRSMMSSDIRSGFKTFCRRTLEFVQESVQCRQRRLGGLVIEV